MIEKIAMTDESSLMHSTHSYFDSLLMYILLPFASKSSPSVLTQCEKKLLYGFAVAISWLNEKSFGDSIYSPSFFITWLSSSPSSFTECCFASKASVKMRSVQCFMTYINGSSPH